MNKDCLLIQILWSAGFAGLAFCIDLLLYAFVPIAQWDKLILTVIVSAYYLLQLSQNPATIGKPSLFLMYCGILVIVWWAGLNLLQLLIFATLWSWFSRLILFRYSLLITLLDLALGLAAISSFYAMYTHQQPLAMVIWVWLLIQSLIALLPLAPKQLNKTHNSHAAGDFENNFRIAESALETMVNKSAK